MPVVRVCEEFVFLRLTYLYPIVAVQSIAMLFLCVCVYVSVSV